MYEYSIFVQFSRKLSHDEFTIMVAPFVSIIFAYLIILHCNVNNKQPTAS